MNIAWHRALVTVGYGAALGALILGVGGRIAMRVIATATTGAAGFPFGDRHPGAAGRPALLIIALRAQC